MEEDSLHKRGHALESRFFSNVDRVLMDKLRQEVLQEEEHDQLKASTGINDDQLVKDLLALGINDATMSALSLFPLVWVGWADGKMESAEKDAIVAAAKDSNIEAGSPAMAMLSGWLDHKPSEEVIHAWCEYAKELKEIASPETVERVKRTVVIRAHDVAAAAGGFLGMGKVSSAEQAVLEKLEAAFR